MVHAIIRLQHHILRAVPIPLWKVWKAKTGGEKLVVDFLSVIIYKKIVSIDISSGNGALGENFLYPFVPSN